jgi:hypothetical protein
VQQAVDEVGPGFDLFGESSCDQASGHTGLDVRGEIDQAIGIGVGDGADAVPKHEGEIVVVDIFGTSQQRFGKEDALIDRQSLEGRSQDQPDQGGRFGRGMGEKRVERGSGERNGSISDGKRVGQQTDDPGSNVFVGM